MKCISDACLLIEVDSESIHEFSRLVRRKLDDMGVESSVSGGHHHVSIGYFVGDTDERVLLDTATLIASKNLGVRITGIEILEGKTSSLDYVTLRIDGNEELDEALDLIASLSSARKFSDGFKTHLSILTIEKGAVLAAELETLARVLELQVLGLIPSLKINVNSVSLFSSERERVARMPINNAN